MSPPLPLRLSGVSKQFPAPLFHAPEPVLNGVDWSVESGEAVALIGANGAGKSTLLNLCGGHMRPTSGTVQVHGHPAHQPDARARAILAPRPDRLPPNLTPREVLTALAQGHWGRAGSERVEAVLQPLQLTEAGDRRLGLLSSGVRSRVALACGLLPQRDLLLLDEPLTALDPVSRRLVLQALATERARGATLVIATHRVPQLNGLCDRVVQLAQGRIRTRGTVTRVLAESSAHLSYALPPEEALLEGESRSEAAGGLVTCTADPALRARRLQDVLHRNGRVLAVQPMLDPDDNAQPGDTEETLA